MNERISVIVPVYNAGPYLSACIDSILAQKHTNLELIIIDDGSTDGSSETCDAYSRLDPRVLVKHQQNMGLSCARNAGLQLASGDYIAFVDADDWIEPGMYIDLLALLKGSNADIVMCSYYTFFEEMSRASILGWDEGTILEGEEIKEKLIPALISPIDLEGNRHTMEMGFVWRGVYRRDFLLEHNIQFPSGIHYMEDLPYLLACFSKADKIAVSRYPYYHYRQHKKHKTAATFRYMADKYEYRKMSIQEMIRSLETIHYAERMQKQTDWRICLNVINSLTNLCHPDCQLGWTEKVRMARYYVKDSQFQKRALRVGSQFFTPTQRMAVILLSLSLFHTAVFAYTLKNKLL